MRVEGIEKAYEGRPVLTGLDLEVGAGQVLALLGANGAGKTTLLMIVAGLRRPDAGRVVLDGCDIVAEPGRARDLLGLAPQHLGLYPILSVRRNLEFFAEMAGLGRRERSQVVEEVAADLGLSDLLGRRAADLSGGQKRRLHTAVALVGRPRILLLDEPTAGADPASRVRLVSLVRRLAEHGGAVCYTTHYLREVEDLGAEVAILHDGRIRARGPIDDVVARHGGRPHATLRFRGGPPAVGTGPVEVVGDQVVIRDPDPMAAARAWVGGIDQADQDRLVAIDVHRPSIETAYFAVTGDDGPVGPEGGNDHVAP